MQQPTNALKGANHRQLDLVEVLEDTSQTKEE